MTPDRSPQPPSDVWVRRGLEVRRSPIADRGLFTVADIGVDELVWRLGGRLVSSAELVAHMAAENAEGRYVDTITVNEDEHLVLPAESTLHFSNHSCDPNVWHVGPYEVRARRAIAAGEELTIDYGTNSGAAGLRMACRCGADVCRGLVTSDDWQIAELQRRYEGHWVPALAQRISASRG